MARDRINAAVTGSNAYEGEKGTVLNQIGDAAYFVRWADGRTRWVPWLSLAFDED